MNEYFDVSSVASEMEQGSQDPSGQATPNQGVQPQGQASYDPNLMISYKASGRDLNEPLSSVIQRAQRGYDYAQLVEQHNAQIAQKQAEFEQRQAQLAQIEQTWKPYHEYASQNPQWAEHVRQSWESSFSQPDSFYKDDLAAKPNEQPRYQIPPEISQKISQMEQFIEGVKQREALARQASEDQALAQEIDSIRKLYPDIDFQHTDPESGESLEFRVLKHAQQNQIHNFGAAFKDFYFDKLMERSVIRAKEDAAKALTAQHKSGFLATSSKPLLNQDAMSQTPNLKNLSYHRLMDIASQDASIFS